MYNMIVITGPTATGKTALGVAVAKALGGEVIGADSMQLYKRMDIGTAKPTTAEMDGIPHHMVGIVEPDEDFSVSLYVEQATAIADELLERRTVVLNLEATEKAEAGKLLCFLSGVAYSNGGKLKKIANNTYIITPYNVDVMGDLLDELENNGMFFV